jgi:hypothetical protein
MNKVSLYYFRGLGVSFSEHAQMVELYRCDRVKDISALKNVPYVKVDICDEIEDFPCLGSQRYLELEELNQLQDEDIARFGNVSFLRISRCCNVTSADQLNCNKFLVFVECRDLQTVKLHCDQYLNVSLE